MHGGAKGSGAPKGNQNAWRHGTYTAKAIQERDLLSVIIQALREAASGDQAGE
jgi:glucans biosynthesis protein